MNLRPGSSKLNCEPETSRVVDKPAQTMKQTTKNAMGSFLREPLIIKKRRTRQNTRKATAAADLIIGYLLMKINWIMLVNNVCDRFEKIWVFQE